METSKNSSTIIDLSDNFSLNILYLGLAMTQEAGDSDDDGTIPAPVWDLSGKLLTGPGPLTSNTVGLIWQAGSKQQWSQDTYSQTKILYKYISTSSLFRFVFEILSVGKQTKTIGIDFMHSCRNRRKTRKHEAI